MKAAQLKALLSKVPDDAEVVLFDGLSGYYLPAYSMHLAANGIDNSGENINRQVVYFELDLTEDLCDEITPFENAKEIT